MGPLLIKAGRVYDGVAERPLEQAYVAVEGDAITAVGRQAELAGSAEHFAQVIDLGAEATVLPGAQLRDRISIHPRLKIPATAVIPPGTEIRDAEDVLRWL